MTDLLKQDVKGLQESVKISSTKWYIGSCLTLTSTLCLKFLMRYSLPILFPIIAIPEAASVRAGDCTFTRGSCGWRNLTSDPHFYWRNASPIRPPVSMRDHTYGAPGQLQSFAGLSAIFYYHMP